MSGIRDRCNITFEKTVVGNWIMSSLEQPAKARHFRHIPRHRSGEFSLYRSSICQNCRGRRYEIRTNQSSAFECLDICGSELV